MRRLNAQIYSFFYHKEIDTWIGWGGASSPSLLSSGFLPQFCLLRSGPTYPLVALLSAVWSQGWVPGCLIVSLKKPQGRKEAREKEAQGSSVLLWGGSEEQGRCSYS